ncbi:MAG TPA: zf-HC2 domain-containing protein [Candidatus Acidoferrales bacterium]|nr:zf-HC2 domain-containing protein [Candidatus Acidoferrales bacterium]
MNAPKEHEKVRSLLSLAASGVLDSAEEMSVESHARNCPECAAELERWQALAGGLRRLPTPQLSPFVLQRSVALVREAQSAADERRATLRILTPLLALSWFSTIFSWPLFKLASGALRVVLGIRVEPDWRVFAFFVVWTWLAAGVAAAMLSSQQRRDRRLA